MAEELWRHLGNTESVTKEPYPVFEEQYLAEDDFEYPVSVNGKTRFKLTLPKTMGPAEVEQSVLAATEMEKWLNGNPPKKVIVVPGRIVNVVL
jgi:leucyl-tRNA synthetase